jgi:hypothetical protein
MKHSRQRLTLIGIALLFFGPLVIATLMQSDWWDYRPPGLRNAGTLVRPPVPVSFPALHGEQAISTGPTATDAGQPRWSLLYPLNGDCPQSCIDDVTRLRQLHIATGRHVDRIQIVLLRNTSFPEDIAAELNSIYPQFALLEDHDGLATVALQTAAERVLKDTGDHNRSGTEPGWTWLIDPLGNVMLAYFPGQDPSDIRKDLKRLLAYSKMDDT